MQYVLTNLLLYFKLAEFCKIVQTLFFFCTSFKFVVFFMFYRTTVTFSTRSRARYGLTGCYAERGSSRRFPIPPEPPPRSPREHWRGTPVSIIEFHNWNRMGYDVKQLSFYNCWNLCVYFVKILCLYIGCW